MFASITRIIPLTTIRRERRLPVPGQILVRKGQIVSATEIIAQANLANRHILLNLARGLGISAETADQYVQHKAGERVGQGDVIAGPVGLTQRVYRAPEGGVIIQVKNGKVLIEVDSPPYQLRSGLPGIVTDLLGDRAVVVETAGGLVQGVWGNGRIDAGDLAIIANKPEDVFSLDRLEDRLRDCVVLAGYCEDEQVFRTAAGLSLRGLILSSMASALIPFALEATFPVILMEGFGLLPMNTAAFNILGARVRHPVALNAESWDGLAGNRPEIVIPQSGIDSSTEPGEKMNFSPDRRIRVIRAPYRSQIGSLVALRPGLEVFPNGVRTQAAEVLLENGNRVVLPLANLEILE